MLRGNFVHGQLAIETEDLQAWLYKHGFHYQALVKLEGIQLGDDRAPSTASCRATQLTELDGVLYMS
jgi:hypothetical protein